MVFAADVISQQHFWDENIGGKGLKLKKEIPIYFVPRLNGHFPIIPL